MTINEILNLGHISSSEVPNYTRIQTEEGYYMTAWTEGDDIRKYAGSNVYYLPVRENYDYPDLRVITVEEHERLSAERDAELEINPLVIVLKPQEKEVLITSNGDTIVTPDEGFNGLTEVNISIEVPIPEPDLRQLNLSVTENGSYEYDTPDNIDGYNKVNLTVTVPEPIFETETLSVELKENGTYNYTPAVDGYSSVEVTVDVAGSGGGDNTGLDLVALGFTEEDQTEWDNEIADKNARAHALAQKLIDNFPKINPTNEFDDYVKDAFDGGNLVGNTDLIVFPPITNRNSSDWHCNRAFKDCVNLVKVGTIGGGVDGGYIIYGDQMFENCASLEVAPKLYITAASSSMFKGCTKLKDVSNIRISARYGAQTPSMFENCINLEESPSVTSTNNCNKMFKGCTKLKDVSKFNVYFEKLTGSRCSLAETFMNCTSLETLPPIASSNSYNYIGRAVFYTSAFEGCTNFNPTTTFNVDVSSSNTQNYVFSRMFYNCTSLTQPVVKAITNNKGTSHTADYMYYGCKSLKTASSIKFTNFTNISYMYYNCTSLTSIPKMDCSNIEKCSGFAAYCSALTTLGGFTNLGQKANLTGTDWMFRYSPALTRDSILNVFNNLYDRATAGYSVLTFHINSTPLALLSADDIAIATNKGWTISS
jgi:hypothetical protein